MNCPKCGSQNEDGEKFCYRCYAPLGTFENNNKTKAVNSPPRQPRPQRNPNLIRCKDCGKEVSKRVDKCPHCGAPVDKEILAGRSGTFFYIVVGSIILFIVLAVIGSLQQGSQRGTAVTSQETPPKETPIAESPKKEPVNVEYLNIEQIISEYKKLTDVQQKNFVQEIRGGYVKGYGKIKNVEEPTIMSEVRGDYYEVTIEVTGGNSAVVFYPKRNRWVGEVSKGSHLDYRGRIVNVRNWGFWVSAYIVAE